ncbi:NrfD/PsrC family molybdoenzyme membrane anchor subunit [Dietzia sp. B32]|uniref:NrfD/PsrC family molybdoenzyme membrane anchor subunit n=1 Tax=Dietzia sp. B32 TaxID=2915130 RepID=UPI0021AE1318|nr:NrfD/PsrC family molybdoenzyme membrane anchor subunit [Dietzia sp. B32]UVE96977.1 polysulfide reductase NrfD [Dietzia sp. B32]
MVPRAEFRSYYGKPIVKAPPWEYDIAAYLFLGGLAGGSSLLAAGADLAGLPSQRRSARIVAFGGITGSLYYLVNDLGRPERFHHMLRVLKLTSPMSVGTWILSAYGPFAGLALGQEIVPLLPARLARRLPTDLITRASRPAGIVAALVAPAVASYTAVLLTDTSLPSWSAARRELPFVFVGSAAAASGGVGLLLNPLHETGPARRLAVGGAALELTADRIMQRSMGITAEPLHAGRAGAYHRAAQLLTVAGAAGAVLGRRNRLLSAAAGVALAAGSACTRWAVFHAGMASAQDPKYVVVPQRERRGARGGGEAYADQG